MKAPQVVNKLLDAVDDEADPEAYMAALPDRREIVLEVTLTFDRPVEDISMVVHNVYSGLEHVCHKAGLAPDEEEAVTKHIKVRAIKPRTSWVAQGNI